MKKWKSEHKFISYQKYIGTIGSPKQWRYLSPNEQPPHDYAYRLPADLKHSVSYTTMKVLEGGNMPTLLSRNINELRLLEREGPKDVETSDTVDALQPFRRFIHRAVVKKDVQMDAQQHYEKPTLDISLPHVCLLSVQPSTLITVKISHFSSSLHLYYRFPSTAIWEFIQRSQSTFSEPFPSAWRQAIYQIYSTSFSSRMARKRNKMKKIRAIESNFNCGRLCVFLFLSFLFVFLWEFFQFQFHRIY